MIRKDGGTAFPCHTNPRPDHLADAPQGMSLRAYMATKFCAAMVSTINSDDDYYRIGKIAQNQGIITVSEWIAKESCKQADALIAELSK